MNKEDFTIGASFYTATGRWVCVDKGEHFVLAIHEEFLADYQQGEESHHIVIFDHWDFGGCQLKKS